MNTHAAPTTEQERIATLDVLRGFAVLGILVMNIQSYAMPLAAYLNPHATGPLEGRDVGVAGRARAGRPLSLFCAAPAVNGPRCGACCRSRAHKSRTQPGMADAIVYATASRSGAQLITSETHFESLPGVTIL